MRTLDPTRDLVPLGYAANAVAVVDGGGDALQDAINHAQNNPGYWRIVLPSGTYYTSKTLVVGVLGDYRSVSIIGGDAAFPGDGAWTDRFHNARIELKGPNASTSPVLAVTNGRRCYFQGLQFVSQGNPVPAAQADISSLFSSPDFEDWCDPAARLNRFSPQCVVAVDPFNFALPVENRYPTLDEWYMADAWASSGTIFRGCTFEGGVVGVAMSPAGLNNNENSVFEDCYFLNNAIHFSQGQSQARNNLIAGPQMQGSWLAIDDGYVAPGGNTGVGPVLTRGGNIGMTRYVFNLALTAGTMHAIGVHVESTLSLGKLGYGASSAQGGAILSGWTITFATAADYSLDYPEVPFHLATFGRVTLDTCQIHAEACPLRIWNADVGAFVMRSCSTRWETQGGRVPVWFSRLDSKRLQDTQVRTPASVYLPDDPAIIESPVNGGAPVTLTSTGSRTATLDVTTLENLAIGQVLRSIDGAGGYTPQTLDPSQYPYGQHAAIGIVSDIDEVAMRVTVTGIPYGLPMGVPMVLMTHEWIV
ncbi:MAG: hypothetical protein QNJ58_11015 [Desulfobacterales bacterium]|nr:hypothetical protein [Desulfobacterales bacterium]